MKQNHKETVGPLKGWNFDATEGQNEFFPLIVMNCGGGSISGTKRDFCSRFFFFLSFLAHETLKAFITVGEQIIIRQLEWSKADEE